MPKVKGEKKSNICLELAIKEILPRRSWVSCRVVFEGLGVNDAQTPCWLRLLLDVLSCLVFPWSNVRDAQ